MLADSFENITLPELFEWRAQKTPDETAITYEGFSLSYAELNQKANQLAHYLIQQGVKPEVLVGICLDRSLELMISILAVLKAGGAYVPLDPDYPQARLNFTLDDSQAPFLVTNSELIAEFKQYAGKIILIDKNTNLIQSQPSENPQIKLSPHHLAYIIYTSGSTGQPKGVMIEHRSACNLITAKSNQQYFHENARLLQFSSTCFDASIWEIWTAFFFGIPLYIVPSREKLVGETLLRYIQYYQITMIMLPPSVLASLDSKLKSSLHTLLVVGEAPPEALFQEWSKKIRVVNGYGPTEATVLSCCKIYTGQEPVTTIGKPLDHYQFYVLDSQQQPVASGKIGELYIGGAGLARGYLNRPELTQERFILAKDGTRLYKTGDWVQYLPNGELNYIGRVDHQVKIRGFRIELGEIENAIRKYEGLDAVVVARDDPLTHLKRLIAYLVLLDSEKSNKKEVIDILRQKLSTQLPSYMMPTRFVFLEKFPLLPNGKIDRASLPEPEGYTSTGDKDMQSVESKLMNIFAQTLNCLPEEITPQTNFFEYGGHSLLAARVLAQIKNTFKIDIPLRLFYESPTIVALAETIKQNHLDNPLPYPLLTSRNISNEIPLSFAQQRLWFIHQLLKKKSLHNVVLAFKLTGKLDIDALKLAFARAVKRQAILRTYFQMGETEPHQYIAQDINLPFFYYEKKEINSLIANELRFEFNLEYLPLFRITLVKLEEGKHILLLNFHHIIFDGSSLNILAEELNNVSPQPLSIQYADFAIWQREWLNEKTLEKHLNHWREHLAGVPELLDLPTDKERPFVRSYEGDSFDLTLSKELLTDLKLLAKKNKATLFMTLLASLFVLLFRYSKQEDIVLGFPISIRSDPQLEQIIGFFVNILPVRCHLTDTMLFEDLLNQIKNHTLNAYTYKDIPFELLVDKLKFDRNPSRNALFQVIFSLEEFSFNELSLQDLHSEPFSIKIFQTEFDLSFIAKKQRNGELLLDIHFATDLFKKSTIAMMAKHWLELLTSIVATPYETLAKLNLLSAHEKEKILAISRQGVIQVTPSQTLPELFENRVRMTPDNIALVFENHFLSYRELNERVNQLAHYLLKTLALKPETPIGICLEPSFDLIIGILAILKAGGAYVPLDPRYPKDRLLFMLEDSQASILLSHSNVLTEFTNYRGKIMCLDQLKPIAEQSIENPVVNLQPQHLAYLIYTSGSTGRPKGVMVEHRNVSQLITSSRAKDIGFQSSSKVLQINSICFDMSVFEIWNTFYAGASLHLISTEKKIVPQLLQEAIDKNKITLICLAPSILNLLHPEQSTSLKTILLGGEAPTESLLKKWQDRVKLINAYGPTEASMCSSYKIYSGNSPAFCIGKPIDNYKLYILNSNQALVPLGSEGELYIGGPGVVRGYLNRPDLSNEHFVNDPFATEEDKTQGWTRMYKTGDRVRFDANFDLEFIGRIDHQVKIRGYRIELGEIENTLRQHKEVKDTVVIVRSDSTGLKNLIAYIIPTHKTTDNKNFSKTIRLHLAESLPNYMIPSTYVFLEKFPLTSTGKIDRNNLPAPEVIANVTEEKFAEPNTNFEHRLTVIWAEVLNCDPAELSTEDNFFNVGGNSLLLVKLFERIEKEFSIAFEMIDLFRYPTITGFANFLLKSKKI